MVDEEQFLANTFALPQAFGGLSCLGNENNISSCPVCLFGSQTPDEEPQYPIEENPDSPSYPILLDLGSGDAPGIACCNGNNRLTNNEDYDVVAISCLREFSIQ